jgi:multisubunit Na+/H+ antiporter MnhG subunit
VTAHEVAVDALVAAGVAAELLCCTGLVAFRAAIDRLHYAAAASTVPGILLAAAIGTEEGFFTTNGLASFLVAVLLLFLNPVLVHATARVIRAGGGRPLHETRANRG